MFFRRLAGHGFITLAVILASLIAGMMGYHRLAGLSWLDSFLNASMIMGGMGPVDPMTAPAAKIFAGIYALYAGLILLVSVGFLMAPVIHRLLHRLHVKDSSQ